jgi:hypothetical protein
MNEFQINSVELGVSWLPIINSNKLLGWDDSHGVTHKVLKPFPLFLCQSRSEPNAEEVIITKIFYIQLFKTNTFKNGVQMPIRRTRKKLKLIKEKL